MFHARIINEHMCKNRLLVVIDFEQINWLPDQRERHTRKINVWLPHFHNNNRKNVISRIFLICFSRKKPSEGLAMIDDS